MRKLVFVLFLILSACSDGFETKTETYPPLIEPLLCQDYTALNPKGLVPCQCPEEMVSYGSFCEFKNLFPEVYLTAPGTITKESYQTGTILINPNGNDALWFLNKSVRIKGRGNSTWDFPKKPLKLKFDNKESLLGFPKDKEWVFLANYTDKTLMRNLIANEVAKRVITSYSPRNKVVEVFLNGSYQGVYSLTEQIRVSKDRVDVETDDISGGYLIELDRHLVRDPDDYYFDVHSISYLLKEPEETTPERQAYIENYFLETLNSLYSTSFQDEELGYQKYIDTDSFINWYIVHELLKNSDSANFSSIFFHKKAGEKLKMGPAWDFDLAIGNINYTDAQDPEGYWIRSQSYWFSRLFQDPNFEKKVKDRWKELKTSGLSKKDIMDYVDKRANSLMLAQVRNFLKWNILNTYVWPNRVVLGSYGLEVEEMKNWLSIRYDWLDNELSN